RLIGLVLVAGKRRRRRHVGLRDVTAAATTNGSVGVRRIPLVRRGVRRGVLLAAGDLEDRLARGTRAAVERLVGALVGRVLVPRRCERAGEVDLRDRPGRRVGRVVLLPAATTIATERDRGV